MSFTQIFCMYTGNKYIIIGVVVGGFVLLLLILCADFFARKRTDRWKHQNHRIDGGGIPELEGVRFFTFEELLKCTNNFSEVNIIGRGGYGKVYKGTLADGQIVAIKRSDQGSMQGNSEFINEIELLSRVHHKNLVRLVGLCFDHGERMLVYEFIPNGTLMDSLSGNSRIHLDWIKRLTVALGSARSLQYLHELAEPPIIHRDIKSNNILLDEHLNAKLADFGVSKIFADAKKGYVTTQVKGTMGYLDPEYFMTNQLTEKSDIFSFGVVMLEMVTSKKPLQDGKYIVKEIKSLIDKTTSLYNLDGVIDPALLSDTTFLIGFKKFIDVALQCVEDEGVNRPNMRDVVKELDHILQLAGLNKDSETAPVSDCFED